MNEDGVVCIDENMIEVETNMEDIPNKEAMPQVSYANMVSGKTPMAFEDKIQFYPPLVNNEGTRVVVIDPKYIIQAKEEYKNVLYGGIQTRSANKKSGNEAPKDQRIGQQDGGFTLVKRRKGGNKPMDSGPRHMQQHHTQPKDFVNYQRRHDIPVNMGPRKKQANTTCAADNTADRSVPSNPAPGLKEGQTTAAGTSQIHVVETTNRFMLLDEEGNELEENSVDRDTNTKDKHAQKEMNEGWIRKQERTLNVRYLDRLSQDQRFLYDFGEGSSAAARERIQELGTNYYDPEEMMEDVESEIDGTATMMKSDPHLKTRGIVTILKTRLTSLSPRNPAIWGKLKPIQERNCRLFKDLNRTVDALSKDIEDLVKIEAGVGWLDCWDHNLGIPYLRIHLLRILFYLCNFWRYFISSVGYKGGGLALLCFSQGARDWAGTLHNTCTHFKRVLRGFSKAGRWDGFVALWVGLWRSGYMGERLYMPLISGGVGCWDGTDHTHITLFLSLGLRLLGWGVFVWVGLGFSRCGMRWVGRVLSGVVVLWGKGLGLACFFGEGGSWVGSKYTLYTPNLRGLDELLLSRMGSVPGMGWARLSWQGKHKDLMDGADNLHGKMPMHGTRNAWTQGKRIEANSKCINGKKNSAMEHIGTRRNTGNKEKWKTKARGWSICKIRRLQETKELGAGGFLAYGEVPALQFARFNLFKMWKQYGLLDISTNGPKWMPGMPHRNIVGRDKPSEIPESSKELGNEDGNSDIGETRINEARNEGWTRKQERNLNISYSQELNQEQRNEAKRFVVNKHIPEKEVVGKWPKHLVNYFRQLSHLFGFVEGFSWALKIWEEGMDGEDLSGENTTIPMEEVESETDGTAEFMKLDNIVGSNVQHWQGQTSGVDETQQMGTGMYPAANPLSGINEC
ncbi:hypothetical protein L1987_73043 [Smallanthus sonchifolius]|uniref:Uncharacterized protein n=1 Tax=Smallanthus sonchifolius TaxID=185202 RepID=A0ACB9AWX4_9ASTR|nr:hypothetical protein L1987_73043 [Smallanthus sonchifolius]